MLRRVAILVAIVAIAACGNNQEGAPVVSEARIGEPAGPNGALYFTASGYGEADRLLGAETTVAPTVELHESVLHDDGTATMGPVPHMDLPARGELVLEPGGLHVMLLDVDRIEVGVAVTVTLLWEHAGRMDIEAVVVEPGETLGEHDH